MFIKDDSSDMAKISRKIGANTAVVGEDGEVDSEGDAKFGQHMKTGETGCGNDNTTDSIFARRWLYEKWDGLLEIWSFMLFVLKTPLDIMLNGVLLRVTLKDSNLDNYR
ncbi:hypothetical protein Tco_1023589 [Tanacetum coccineum]